jgi:hypothetical protein
MPDDKDDAPEELEDLELEEVEADDVKGGLKQQGYKMPG